MLYFGRNFLRLGDPLSCSINDVNLEELEEMSQKPIDEKRKEDDLPNNSDDTNLQIEQTEELKDASLNARPLSLARIQSLVSMTTPRDGILYGSSSLAASPPFVEFDMSLDGFGCLFLPSVFPQVHVHVYFMIAYTNMYMYMYKYTILIPLLSVSCP